MEAINSILFALILTDDALLLRKSEDKYILSLKLLLHEFEMASSLKINFDESSVILLEEPDDLQTRIASMFNCQIGTFPATYLGMPLGPGKLTRGPATFLE